MSFVSQNFNATKYANVIPATGDNVAIDKKRRVFYFLGDTAAGTVLVGVNMTDGSQVRFSMVLE